jgi:Tfp pilus assembly protein PilF
MEKVVELQPDHIDALNYLGYTWAENNTHLEKALAYIKKAIALKPDNGYILDSLGWVYFRMGELEKAKTELERALALEPKDPYIHEHMGDIYLATGQKQKAKEAYRQAMEMFKDQKKKEKMQQKIDAAQ